MTKKSIGILLLILSVFAISTQAWDDAGHKTIAYIAWERMTPEARQKAFDLLMSAPEEAHLSTFYMQDSRSEAVKRRELFMIAATWSDIVRDRKFKVRNEKYHRSNWHYADTFWREENGQVKILENFPEDHGKATEKIAEFTKLMQTPSAPDAEKAIGLAWILHLVGDIHQPLHTSARVTELEPKGDQGGNLFSLTPKDTPREKSVNLHWFWDSILERNFPRNDTCDGDYIPVLAEMIMRKHPFSEMQNRLNLGEFNGWQQEGVRLAMTDVFTPTLIRYEMPSEGYRKNAYRIAQQQMALAGYRIGEMLNRILAAQPTAETTTDK